MSIYSYHLPPHLLAHTPAEPRDSARLLRWPEGDEFTFANLSELLNPGDLVVLNESQVIPARLYATRPSREAGKPDVEVELLLHRPLGADLKTWEVFAKPAKRLRHGDALYVDGEWVGHIIKQDENHDTAAHDDAVTSASNPACPETGQKDAEKVPEKGQKPHGCRKGSILALAFHNGLDSKKISGFLQAHGHTPLPPYIKTQDSDFIKERYQTVYANPAQPGSVAAPTAGLHFTNQVFDKLKERGIKIARVTLHVGAGTFQNPTQEQILSGKLHAEWAQVSPETAHLINETKDLGGKIVAVGTTSLRTLETWGKLCSPNQGFSGETTIFIRPGYRFRVVDKLLTNFHLPESSLLMLVAAFIGESEMSELYQYAIAENFRFYSFGDTSLLTRKES